VSKRFLPGGEAIAKDAVQQVGTDTFEVVSQTDKEKRYEVRVAKDFAMCTCPLGFNGGPCKHQFAIVKHFGLHSMNFLPVHDADMRRHLLFLATGTLSTVLPHFQMTVANSLQPSTMLCQQADAVNKKGEMCLPC